MKILVTGGSGFIGRNVRESYLAHKYNIIAPAHKELDLLDEDRLRSFFRYDRIDVVIHAAAKPFHRNARQPGNVLYENTRMFFNLARNSDYFRKMLVIGSGAIYDMRYYQHKMKEEHFDEHLPADELGLCKYVCGKYIQHVDKITDLRVFGIFGKYEDYAIRFISNMICKTLFDLPLTMKQNRRFDYLYIDDLMPILDYFIQNQSRHNAYNVTPDESVELFVLAQKIRDLSGKDLPVIIEKGGMGTEYSGDNARLKKEVAGLSFTPLESAIRQLYGWYVENRALVNRDELLVDK